MEAPRQHQKGVCRFVDVSILLPCQPLRGAHSMLKVAEVQDSALAHPLEDLAVSPAAAPEPAPPASPPSEPLQMLATPEPRPRSGKGF